MELVAKKKEAANKHLHGNESLHEEFIHPNMEVENDISAQPVGKKRSKAVIWWKNVDAIIVKPLLLHNYDKELHKRK
jgi:hypothetical protein